MPEETKTPAAKTTEKPKAPRVGDTVHLVAHHSTPGARFGKVHVEAKVASVVTPGEAAKRKGAGNLPAGIQHVDLEAELPDGTPIVVTSAPRDDGGVKSDTWHFVEDAVA